MKKLALLLCVTGCAHAKDLGMFYTERGLASAEAQWDNAYYMKLDECKQQFAPETQEALDCFGPMFAANKLVEAAVEEAVFILQEYWDNRARGYEPDLKLVAKRIQHLVDKLPEDAKRFFERVKGLR